MKDQNKAVVELKDAFTKAKEKYEMTLDDLVKIVEYALGELRHPAPSTGTLTPKGQAELEAKQAKQDKRPPPVETKVETKSHK